MLWVALVPAFAWLVSRGWRLRPRSFDAGDLLFVLAFVLGTRLAVATLMGETQAGRFTGAAFSVLSWVGTWATYRLFKDGDDQRRGALLRGLMFLFAVQGPLIGCAVLAHPSFLSSLELPLSFVLDSSSIGQWATPSLSSLGWFGESQVPRSNGIMGASAWSGGFGALGLVFVVCGWRAMRALGVGRVLLSLAMAGAAIALIFSLSRLSYAIVCIFILIAGVFGLAQRFIRRMPQLWAVVFLMVSAVVSAVVVDVPALLAQQDALRPGSSASRFSSYLEGVTAVLSEGPLGVLFGFGFKPYLERQDRGIGSESTYISLFVRGGIIVVLIFLAFFVWRFVESARARDWPSTLVLPAVAIHAASADLDVGTLTMVMAVLVLAPMVVSDMRRAHNSQADVS